MVSKLYAGRDIDFVSVAIDADLVDIDLIRSRITMVSNNDNMREIVINRLGRIISNLKNRKTSDL